jgi:hypothetical protein
VTVYVYPFTPRQQRPRAMPPQPPPRSRERHYWILGAICFVLAALIIATA